MHLEFIETWWVVAFLISVSVDLIGLWRHGSREAHICRMSFPCVHIGMHVSYFASPYSSHNVELWRKSSRCLWKAKRNVFIWFLVAKTIFLEYSTLKNYLHTNSLVSWENIDHLDLIWLTKKTKTYKETGGKKKWGSIIFPKGEKLYGTSVWLLAFFLLLCYGSKSMVSLLLCWK